MSDNTVRICTTIAPVVHLQGGQGSKANGARAAADGDGDGHDDGRGKGLAGRGLISVVQPPPASSCGCLTPAAIPYVLALTDCCMGLASG